MKQILSKFILSGLILGLCSSALAGRDSGGADVLPKEPVTIESMREVVEDEIVALLPILYRTYMHTKYVRANFEPDYNPLGQKIFYSFENKSIQTLSAEFNAINFDKKEKGPCYEPHSLVPKDAATYIENQYVCISLSRLRARSASRAEILALLAHEFAHLNGAGGTEASALQNQLFLKSPYDEAELRQITTVASSIYNLSLQLSKIYMFKEKHLLCGNFPILINYFKELGLGYSGFNPISQSELSLRLVLRVQLFFQRVCIGTGAYYEDAFQGQKDMRLDTLAQLVANNVYTLDSESFPVDRLGFSNAIINFIPENFDSLEFKKAMSREFQLLQLDLGELASVMSTLFQPMVTRECIKWKLPTAGVNCNILNAYQKAYGVTKIK